MPSPHSPGSGEKYLFSKHFFFRILAQKPYIVAAMLILFALTCLFAVGEVYRQYLEVRTSLSFTPRLPAPAVDTSSWQVYRNDQYGFEFLYPKDWKVSSWAESAADFFRNGILYLPLSFDIVRPSSMTRITVSHILLNYDNQTIDRQLGELYCGPFPPSRPSFSMQCTHYKNGNGVDIVEHGYWEATQDRFIYFHYVPMGKLILGFYGETMIGGTSVNPMKEVLDQILSTFKFTDARQVDTSDWKTYTNDQYGFKFNYPTTLSIIEKYPTGGPLSVVELSQNGSTKLFTFIKDLSWASSTVRSNNEAFLRLATPYVAEKYVVAGNPIISTYYIPNDVTSDRAVRIIANNAHSDFVAINIKSPTAENWSIANNILSTLQFTDPHLVGVSGWKTYHSDLYKLEFDYPAGYPTDYPENVRIDLKNGQIDIVPGGGIGMIMTVSTTTASVDSFIEHYESLDKLNKITAVGQYSISGITGERLSARSSIGLETYYVFIPRPYYNVVVHYLGNIQELILSTLRFTDTTSSDISGGL